MEISDAEKRQIIVALENIARSLGMIADLMLEERKEKNPRAYNE